jgi:hypothetical protein
LLLTFPCPDDWIVSVRPALAMEAFGFTVSPPEHADTAKATPMGVSARALLAENRLLGSLATDCETCFNAIALDKRGPRLLPPFVAR